MKKTIATLMVASVGLGAFAQGSLTKVQSMFGADGITTGDAANASSPTQATSWYTGNIALEIFYASAGSVTSQQIANINSLGGSAGYSLAVSDGFALVSATSLTGSTAGSLSFAVNDGGFTAADPNTIGLLSPAPTSTVGWILMYAVGAGGTYNGWAGVLAFSQNTGGNPTTVPAGTASNIATDPQGMNLVLSSVPEPTTVALAGLGIAGLVALRRKK